MASHPATYSFRADLQPAPVAFAAIWMKQSSRKHFFELFCGKIFVDLVLDCFDSGSRTRETDFADSSGVVDKHTYFFQPVSIHLIPTDL